VGVEDEIENVMKKVVKLVDDTTKFSTKWYEAQALGLEYTKRIREEYSKSIKERSGGLEDIRNQIQALKETNEFQTKRSELIENYRKKLVKLNNEVKALENNYKSLTPAQVENLRLLQLTIGALNQWKDLSDEDINRQEKIANIRNKAEQDTMKLIEKRTMLEIEDPINKIDQLSIEKQLLQTSMAEYTAVLALTEKESERLKLLNQINDKKIEILKITEKEKRAESIGYDTIATLKEQMVSWHDMATDSLVKFTQGFAQGVGSLFADLTSGFQGQQQEVANLKVEYGGLGQELEEAIGEGDIERVNQLKGEMMALSSQIETLEDPLENLKEGFKDFFKSLIDGIQEAISQWIAMQIVMKVLGSIGGGGGFQPQASLPNVQYAATGGVLPSIKSFRKFSQGGLTGGSPTMALLGDNASGRELVIPSENIKNDNVSGYMRDSKQPITVVNILTKEDIAMALAGTEGQRVIVNQIGRDLNEGGPVSKMLRV